MQTIYEINSRILKITDNNAHIKKMRNTQLSSEDILNKYKLGDVTLK